MKTAFFASLLLILVSLTSATPSASAGEPPWLGVIIVNGGGGASIIEVITGSPADDAGLRTGDVILRVGEARTQTANGLISTVAGLSIGTDTEVEFKRNGKAETAVVTLSRRLTESEILGRRMINSAFPKFKLAVLAGDGSGDSDDHWGDVGIFYFYSSSCSSCATLEATLDELAAEDGVQVFAISSAGQFSTPAVLKAQIAAAPSGATVLEDEILSSLTGNDSGRTLRGHLQATGDPIVVVTDRKRVVRYAASGVPPVAGKTSATNTLSPASGIDIKDLRFSVRRALKESP